MSFLPYTTLLLLKFRANEMIYNSQFCCSSDNRHCKYYNYGNQCYLVKNQSDAKCKYTKDDIVGIHAFFIDNLYV